jgi:hypothetical protein
MAPWPYPKAATLSIKVKEFLAKFTKMDSSNLSDDGVVFAMDCLYRGHSDMPLELSANYVSTVAPNAMKKLFKEMGEKYEDWALTDDTAALLVQLINDGHIVIKRDPIL